MDWNSWRQVFNSIEVFAPLIEQIFIVEGLNFDKIEPLKEGTNAVFKVGAYVVKIYAPKETGMNTESDYKTELFGIERANSLKISTPKLVAKGEIKDKYIFRYLIMEYINGHTLGDIEDKLNYDEKIKIGQKLRLITDNLNSKCEKFNHINIIERELNNKSWSSLPHNFNEERIDYLRTLTLNNEVYVHGDLNPDNVIIDDVGEVYIIDFADAHLAPIEYEFPAIICELFCFDKAFMRGYFGEKSIAYVTEQCFKGLLLHQFGSNIIKCNLGTLDKIDSLKALKEKLYLAIDSGKQIFDLGEK